MDFLSENDNEIIRNIREPEDFVDYSFEAIPMGVGIVLIIGELIDKKLIDDVLNPNKKSVQAVKFKKPEWSMEEALDWLKDNQRHFNNYKEIKKYEKKDLKDINGVEIFSAGVWNGDKYTTKDLDSMVEAFNETKEHVRPFLKLGHSDKQKILESEGLPAAGWIGKIYRNGEKLLADFIDIPNKIYELIENKAYRKVSSEIYIGVQIKDKKYNHMLGAVALLGAETPGVMNLSDILARFGLKDYHSIKSYAQNENNVELKQYNINDKNKQGGPMAKTEKEIELELKLKEATEALKATKETVKEFKTNLEKTNTELNEVKEAKAESDKKALEAEVKAFNTQIEKQVDELVASKLITKSMKPFALQLLKNEVNEETKKYSFKVGEDQKDLDRFELIKEFTSLAKKASDVNFDDNSEEGKQQTSGVDEKAIEKYALENEVSYADAYKALYSGKLQVERPDVEEN